MSVSLWRWTEACDKRMCIGDCDRCSYDNELPKDTKQSFVLTWIPCSERLPDFGDNYIVCGKQKYSYEKEWQYFTDVAYNYGDYIDGFWDTFNDWIEGQETHIIAWAYMPKPYKE